MSWYCLIPQRVGQGVAVMDKSGPVGVRTCGTSFAISIDIFRIFPFYIPKQYSGIG
jgi:hypothetical protein